MTRMVTRWVTWSGDAVRYIGLVSVTRSGDAVGGAVGVAVDAVGDAVR